MYDHMAAVDRRGAEAAARCAERMANSQEDNCMGTSAIIDCAPWWLRDDVSRVLEERGRWVAEHWHEWSDSLDTSPRGDHEGG